MKKILILIIIAAGIGAFVYFHKQKQAVILPNQDHTVVLTKNGFEPSEITIRKGDTVTFKTTAGKPFWPASNLHPTHGIYPEFDPKQPVDPDKTWSFQLDTVGDWKYHDHLAPNFRGVIKANDKGKSAFNLQPDWENQIAVALKDKGLDQAFEILANLYATQPAFAAECHGYSHELGNAVYGMFADQEDFKLTPKTSYCGNGFYHGFMEALLQDTGDIRTAQEFCRTAGEKLMSETVDAEGACYHGIGHGAVDGGDPRAWGDAQAMIEPAMKLCEQVAGQDHSKYGKMYRCTTGAYNAIEILSADDKYKLTSLRSDPFAFCQTQSYDLQDGCYNNMVPALMRLTKADFLKSGQTIEKIPEKDYVIRSSVMSGLFHEFIRLNLAAPNYNIAAGVKLCHQLSQSLQISCIDGLSGGHMKYGEPGQEYLKGLAFCGSDILNDAEQGTCYRHILPRLRVWYSADKSQEICARTPQQYQEYCPGKP